MATKSCAWCGEWFAASRSDAVTCSKRCRQARSRLGLRVAPRAATRRVSRSDTSHLQGGRFAYADPPYPGLSERYYGSHVDFAGEVDHCELVNRLTSTYDGWALSTSADPLPRVLALCPPGVRVAAWVRGPVGSRSWTPAMSWEPVIYYGSRPLDPSLRTSARLDSLVHGVTPYTSLPGRVIGAKPAAFSSWLFDLLGLIPTDELDDLYPGSGLVGRAWAEYVSRSARPQMSAADLERV